MTSHLRDQATSSRLHDGAAAARNAVTEVRAAVAVADWPEVVRLVGLHWSILLDEATDVLDEALRVTPLPAFHGHPAASAIRDIRLHTSADAVDRMLGTATMPEPGDMAALEDVARSARALSLLSVAASRMIAFRVRGHMDRAGELAGLVERLGRIGAVHQPHLLQPRLPAALLQAGITRGLADDLAGAAITLRDAYERAPQSRVGYVARDAAGKSALFHALAGDITAAQTWLHRAEAAPEARGWYVSRVALSSNTARALIGIESLDRATVDDALPLLEHSVNREQGWGPAITYVQARFGLVWGERRGALLAVQRDRARYADWLDQGSTFGPLLAQAEAELRLSLGHTHQVLPALGPHADHPVGRNVRARLSLAHGDHATAGRLASSVLAVGHTPRVDTDALAIRVLSHPDPTDGRAREAYDDLDAAVTATGAVVARHTVSEHQHHAVAMEPRTVDADVRRLFPLPEDTIRLTARQRMILERLHQGQALTEIAAREYISYNTVKTHARTLYRRLGVSSANEAVQRALDAGLLE
jgi:LuxR family maltose regulon positive regulatory protein